MKLRLPHKTHNLDLKMETDDRLALINRILTEEINFQDQTMTVEEYFSHTWDKQNTKVALDIIGYFLTKEDKKLEILSNSKRKEMENGSNRHTTFSGMGIENQVAVGLVDIDDSNYS